MSIATMAEKSKVWLTSIPKDILFLLVSILAVSASFGLGMITEREMGKHEGVIFGTFEETATLGANASSAVIEPQTPAAASVPIETTAKAIPPGAKYVASKSGTRYYLPSCSGANRIKEENKVWFATIAEAEAEGLTAASNCPGL